MEQIKIFDTTLRDGEQSPGASMNTEEKIRVAKQLEILGVDIMEAGFPLASEDDFNAVSEISKIIKNSTIAALARALPKDVERAGEAIKDAKKGRIHTFIGTSNVQMEKQFNITKEKAIQLSVDAVKLAKTYTPDVEFSAMDATRTDIDFLYNILEKTIAAGATTVNIPDTVGYTLPEEFGKMIKGIKKNVPNIDQAIISVHCHNDLGLAVANSLESIKNGARQVECTINGLGERAGNAALEEIVMSLKTRRDHYGEFETNINTTKIIRTSRLVSKLTGMRVQRNKAIVGKNAFAHESGIHQDGVIKHRATYEIMNPKDVGLEESDIVLGKHSGRNAIKQKLAKLGIKADDEAVNKFFPVFKRIADEQKEVSDKEVLNYFKKHKMLDLE
ncbi:MAG: 2-isopropylmalate synthase [Candidatus Diapherotrites archaeon]|uniref:2-isopropylmalate synthase n=1 Tax=Candidatus Iainarchaeum sp. TaxID=3101447 RepID=A0A8T5GGQ6_9ARCH|nr:2-isopropylmalate synthase [Candidatus Diapherotrites archaeon]MBT7241265.1 2-isopropylmalate synthase [Candidatus Diapherotrites archaeon]